MKSAKKAHRFILVLLRRVSPFYAYVANAFLLVAPRQRHSRRYWDSSISSPYPLRLSYYHVLHREARSSLNGYSVGPCGSLCAICRESQCLNRARDWRHDILYTIRPSIVTYQFFCKTLFSNRHPEPYEITVAVLQIAVLLVIEVFCSSSVVHDTTARYLSSFFGSASCMGERQVIGRTSIRKIGSEESGS